MYFSDENAQKIDAIRTQIEVWKAQNAINQNEYFILLATLLESTSFFANVAGVYAAFCKAWDKRALKPFVLKPLMLLKSAKSHQCFCGNALEVLQSCDTTFDILYLDPPYNHRQYAPNYHLLETIAKSPNYRNLVLSYNSEGIMSKAQIEAILRTAGGENAKLYFTQIDYPRFQSQAKRGAKSIKEFVWILQKS